MNKSYIFLVCVTLLPTTHYSYNSADQDFDTQLNTLQQSLDMLITQSDIDPEVAQDIKNQINVLNQQIQANIKEDEKDIRVAAGLCSILETSNMLAQVATIPNSQTLLNSLKYAARINTLHKLITGACAGKLQNQPYYTNPYTESIGFTLNNWVINGILQALLANVHPTIPGTTLTLDVTAPVQDWLLQATAGIITHYAWLLQKKLAFSYQQSQQQ